MKALVGNINRHALHDGPGIRTTVFFKGCPLHCPWCHNPELISGIPQIAFYPERCIACADCKAVCPLAAVDVDTIARINRNLCNGCGLCTEVCPSEALILLGRKYELDELVEILLRDRLFYEVSGGGVTLSGGEPTQHLAFIGPLLQRLHREGIHTAIETNGLFSYQEFASAALDSLSLILFDVKFIDPDRHRQVTGMDNTVILKNLSRLLAIRSKDVIVRIPMIPGYTATQENIRQVGEFLRQNKARYYSLLPYHPFGLAKADALDMPPDPILQKQPTAWPVSTAWHKFFHDIELINP